MTAFRYALWLMVTGLCSISPSANADQTDALPQPDGLENHLGTDHDLPDVRNCGSCHNGLTDKLAGPTAIQLDHDGAGLTLTALANEGRLSHPPNQRLVLPGSALDVAALGYLHANCGNCHNEIVAAARLDAPQFIVWLHVDQLSSVAQTPTVLTTSAARALSPPLPGVTARRIMIPGRPEDSLMHIRMLRRGEGQGGMPPDFGSDVVHTTGSATIAAWITSLQ